MPYPSASLPRLARRLPALSSLALALAPLCAQADAAADKALAARVDQLLQRMQQLEQRNQELERKVQQLTTKAPAAATPTAQPAAAGAWGMRLTEVEREQQALKQQVDTLAHAAPHEHAEEEEGGGDEGLQVEGSVVAVLQQVNGGGSAHGEGHARANYRGDIGLSLPLGSVGEARTTAVGQLRFGQGNGVELRPTYTGTVNSTTFEAAAGSDETYAIVAQAYLQFDWALDGGRFNDLAGNRAELTLGKMDFFGFFDQNAVAGDEGAQFLNNVFVHNPMLDSGGDIGADAYGFAPGLRAAYFNEGDNWGWGASMGVFGSGGAAGFGSGGSRPLVIGQVEAYPKQINGEPRGTYRLYAWTNGRTSGLDGETEQRHSGFGLSVDQRLGAEWNLFGRYGQRTVGDGSFDSGLTLGFEHGGRAWGRGSDAIGLAAGWLKTGDAWRDATAADGSLAGYAASGTERLLELYYRFKLNEHLDISPDFQWIQRAGGDGDASTVRVFGVRGSVGF